MLAAALAPRPKNYRKVTLMHSAWAVLVQMDTALPAASPDRADIPVGPDDAPLAACNRTAIPYVRALANVTDGVRSPVSFASHFIDASFVYGSSEAHARALRNGTDGLLRVKASDNTLPVYTPADEAVAPMLNPLGLSLAAGELRFCGDPRCNAAPEILALTTVFVREHNRRAGILKTANPSWSDDKLFQEARKWIIAHVQKVTYIEYLPPLLGRYYDNNYAYNPSFNPTLSLDYAFVANRYVTPYACAIILLVHFYSSYACAIIDASVHFALQSSNACAIIAASYASLA